jgi:hypothetical protein
MSDQLKLKKQHLHGTMLLYTVYTSKYLNIFCVFVHFFHLCRDEN